MILAICSVLLVSIASLVLLLVITFSTSYVKALVPMLMALAAGTLYGNVFIHMIPESLAKNPQSLKIPIAVLTGLLASCILDVILRSSLKRLPSRSQPTVCLSLITSSFHNFTDGLMIGSAYYLDRQMGMAVTAAIFSHEVTHKFGSYAVLMNAGISPYRTVQLNILPVTFATIGVIMVFLFGSFFHGISSTLLPFTAGAILHLVGTHLMPDIFQPSSSATAMGKLLFFALGIGSIIFIKLL